VNLGILSPLFGGGSLLDRVRNTPEPIVFHLLMGSSWISRRRTAFLRRSRIKRTSDADVTKIQNWTAAGTDYLADKPRDKIINCNEICELVLPKNLLTWARTLLTSHYWEEPRKAESLFMRQEEPMSTVSNHAWAITSSFKQIALHHHEEWVTDPVHRRGSHREKLGVCSTHRIDFKLGGSILLLRVLQLLRV
jgi:hypothetical protein